MYRSVYDLKMFYNSPAGEMASRAIGARIRNLWPQTKGLQVLGCGYALPFLHPFMGEADNVIAMMPKGQGAHHWPRDSKNIVFLSDEEYIPLPNCSMDRILIVHHLECCENLQGTLRECWRVLKPNGALMVVVPSRTGFWARSDWSPFGQGSPFTYSQLSFYLRDNLFVRERYVGALYTPPIQWNIIMRSSALIEYIGRHALPFMAGVHIIEASKQLYAGVDKTGTGTPVLSGALRPKGMGAATPIPTPRVTTHKKESI